MKRVITKQEEFTIMTLVLDKFLWLGVIIMAFGFYLLITGGQEFWTGMSVLVAGAIILLLFMWIIMKEYNYVKN